MNPLKLLSLKYLFDLTPGYNYAYNEYLLVLFILIFIASFKVSALLKNRGDAKIESTFFAGIPSFMRRWALLGILLNFFRDQNIPLLGMRIWLLTLILSLPAYLAFTWRKYILKRENFKNKDLKEGYQDKYLPKPKKKARRKKKSR